MVCTYKDHKGLIVMGMTFYNLTMEDLCDLMCGTFEEDYEGEK